MGFITAIKAVFSALGALFGFLKDRQLIDAGKAKAQNENAQKTLDTIAKVNAPITDAERDGVWDGLKSKRKRKPNLPTNPGP